MAIEENTKNFLKYARYKVANKGFLDRVWHSQKLHSVRSATHSQGSAASKGIGMFTAVARASLALIPIPAIGSLIAIAQSTVEGKIRAYCHKKHISGNPSADPDYVKFALKEASVEDLDRYRKKVEDAVGACNKALQQWEEIQKTPGLGNGVCNPKLNLAMALAQAERRMFIFETAVLQLKTLMDVSAQWSQTLCKGLKQSIKDAEDNFKTHHEVENKYILTAVTPEDKIRVTAEIMQRHAKCDDFCVFKGKSINTTWDSIRMTLADITREVTSPIDADTLLSFNKSSFESDDQLKNY